MSPMESRSCSGEKAQIREVKESSVSLSLSLSSFGALENVSLLGGLISYKWVVINSLFLLKQLCVHVLCLCFIYWSWPSSDAGLNQQHQKAWEGVSIPLLVAANSKFWYHSAFPLTPPTSNLSSCIPSPECSLNWNRRNNWAFLGQYVIPLWE